MAQSSPWALSSHIALMFNTLFSWQHYCDPKVPLRDVKFRQSGLTWWFCSSRYSQKRGTSTILHTACPWSAQGKRCCPQVCSTRRGTKHSTKLWFGVEAAKGCPEIPIPVSLCVQAGTRLLIVSAPACRTWLVSNQLTSLQVRAQGMVMCYPRHSLWWV